MKIKGSKSNTVLIIGISMLMIFMLFGIQSLNKKTSKRIIVPKIEKKTSLSSIQITLREKHFNKIKKKRDRALADGVMETNDNDYVPAIITFNGEDFKAKVRLKGDWTDHLQGVKWSYRVKLKGDKTIMGMRKFSIHSPKTRGYISEWLYHKVNKSEGLMGLRYDFLEGFLHIKLENSDKYINKKLGIYAIEETFDKRTIESNNRKEGLFLRFSEKFFWKEMKQVLKITKQTGYKRKNKTQPIFRGTMLDNLTTFRVGKTMSNKELNKQFILAKNLLEDYKSENLSASEVFDVKRLASYIALTNLFGAYHGMASINLRFYYNPTTSLFEPISYDGNAGHKLPNFQNYIYSDVEKDTIYIKELIEALEEVSQASYLDNLFAKYNSEITVLESILKKEFKNATLIKKENYYYNQNIIKEELKQLKSRLNNIRTSATHLK